MSESEDTERSLPVAVLPPLRMLFSPRQLWSFFREFVVGWLTSRDKTTLLVAIPAAVAVLACGVGFGWLSNDSGQSLRALQMRFQQAADEDDHAAMHVCLNALIARDSNEPLYRLQLAGLYADDGRFDTARAIAETATKQHPRFVKGHLWLAELTKRQFGSTPKALTELSTVYQNVLKNDPDNAIAMAGLGEAYLRQGQPLLAQPLLQKTVREIPETGLLLARALATSGQTDGARQVAKQTASRFKKLLTTDSKNISYRLRWAEALRLANQKHEAQQVLTEGLALSNDPQLRRALSDLVVITSREDVARGIATEERNTKLILQAFHVAPANPRAIESLCRVASMQFVQCEPDALQAAVSTVEQIPDNKNVLKYTLLGWLRYLQKDRDGAVTAIRKAASAGGIDETIQLARLQTRLEDFTAAAEVTDRAVQKARQAFESRQSIVDAVELVRVLDFAEQWDEAIAVIEQLEANEVSARLLTSIRLRQFDHAMNQDERDSQSLLKLAMLLQESAAADDGRVILRLANLAAKGDAAGEWAEEHLRKALSEGIQTATIHAMLGANAVAASEFGKALPHLEFSLRATPENPVVCNNLAYALTMCDSPDHQRAYTLASRSLQELPGHPEVLETRGRALIALKRYEEALSDLQLALMASKDSVNLHELLATAYEGTGDLKMSELHRKLRKKVEAKTSGANKQASRSGRGD